MLERPVAMRSLRLDESRPARPFASNWERDTVNAPGLSAGRDHDVLLTVGVDEYKLAMCRAGGPAVEELRISLAGFVKEARILSPHEAKGSIA